MSRRDWSPSDDAVLREMLPAGASYREVGNRLNRSISAVASRARKLRIKQPEEMRSPKRHDHRAPRQRKFTPEECEAMLKAYWSGVTAAELAATYGLSVEAMKGRLKRMGAYKRKSVDQVTIKPTRQDEVAELLSRGMTFEQIAGALFITTNAVEKSFARICRNLGQQAQ